MMHRVPRTSLTLPAVVGRRLSEGLGHTEVRSALGMVVMLPEPVRAEKAQAAQRRPLPAAGI
jgi:hypothetical protein